MRKEKEKRLIDNHGLWGFLAQKPVSSHHKLLRRTWYLGRGRGRRGRGRGRGGRGRGRRRGCCCGCTFARTVWLSGVLAERQDIKI